MAIVYKGRDGKWRHRNSGRIVNTGRRIANRTRGYARRGYRTFRRSTRRMRY